jgi:hypothetical protein
MSHGEFDFEKDMTFPIYNFLTIHLTKQITKTNF